MMPFLKSRFEFRTDMYHRSIFTILLLFVLACSTDPVRNSDAQVVSSQTIRQPSQTPEVISSTSCQFNREPIDELFQIMLARSATDSEVCHYANLVRNGFQVAYFEPYPTTAENMVCGWVSASSDVNQQGIPFFNSKEWTERFGNPGFMVSALFKTLFGKFPNWNVKSDPNSTDPHSLAFWVNDLKQIAAKNLDKSPFQQLSLVMQKTLPNELHLDGTLVKYVFRRQLNREPDFSGCSLNMSPSPKAGSDCFFLNGLATGSIVIVDVVHFVRSTTEYIRRNIKPSCYLKLYPDGLKSDLMVSIDQSNPSPLVNQHAIGESISEIYRVLLSRYPTQDELGQAIQSYGTGNTQGFLKSFADSLSSHNSK